MSLRKNSKHRNFTLEKHIMKSIKYKKDKLYIENQKIFFNAFNTIKQLFFTIVYKNNYSNMDISRSSFSGTPPLMEKSI